MSTPNTPASNDFVLVRDAAQRLVDRFPAELPDYAPAAVEVKALRSALAAAPAFPEPASNEAPGRGGELAWPTEAEWEAQTEEQRLAFLTAYADHIRSGDTAQKPAPKGWVLMPAEATDTMVLAWQSAFSRQLQKRHKARFKPGPGPESCEKAAYKVMVSVRPKVQP